MVTTVRTVVNTFRTKQSERNYTGTRVCANVPAVARREDDRYWQQFGDWVRARREQQQPDRWTQEVLATELSRRGTKVTRNWINQIENGHRPGPELVRAIDALLGPIPDFAAEPVPDLSGLLLRLDAQARAIDRQAAAIEAQADAINRLAEALAGREPDADVLLAVLAQRAKRDLGDYAEEADQAEEPTLEHPPIGSASRR